MSLFHLTQAIELGDWAAVEAAAVYISRSEPNFWKPTNVNANVTVNVDVKELLVWVF